MEAGRGVPEFDIHDRLRKARELSGLDRAALADEIGVSRNTIGNYEGRATSHLKPIVLRQWALRTGVPYQWLLTGEGSRHDRGPDGLPRLDSNQQPSGYTGSQVSGLHSVVQGPWSSTIEREEQAA